MTTRLLTALLLAVSLAAGQEADPSFLASFDYVWTTVRDKHWDPNLGAVDWDAVKAELRPRMERAENIGAARKVLTEMLERLHLSHFRIIPGTVYSELGAEAPVGGDGTTGIDVRVLGEQALVTSVEPNSPAARGFVSPGWRIRRIGNFAVDPLIQQVQQSNLRDLTLRRAILLRLEGPPGDSVRVEFLDGHDQLQVRSLNRIETRGRLSSLGYLGPSHVWFDAHRIDDERARVGYVAFNLFLDPANLMSEFGEAVQGCMKCDGFVIDLRGNPGGLGAMAMGMAGWFVDEKNARLGTLFLRETALKFVINPRPQTFAGPLAVLIDGTSASTSEIFAGGLQDLKRARIFGTRSAAAALPSVIEKLPDGDAFQFAIANYVSEGGKELEGQGVKPDVETPLTREALLAGKDPALDAALEWIRTQKGKHE